jgi:hypothetical protein
MSWHFLLDAEEASSRHIYWDGIRCVPSRLRTIVDGFYSHANEMDYSINSRSGMTSVPLMDVPGERESMSSQEGSPVRTSVSRVKVSELPESVQVYGSRCCALLGRLGLALSSRKTVRTCVPVGLAPLSRDLPAWGMTVGGECWEVGTSASHKDVTVYGYSQVVDGSLYDSLPSAFHASAAKNLTVPCTVSTIPSVPVLGLTTLKTVDGKSEMKVLVLSPTPLKDDWKGGTITKHSTSGRPRMDQFRHLVKIIFGWTYPIPTHTERLMGFPIGWSDLKPLEMRRFQQWQQQHSAFFPQDLSN